MKNNNEETLKFSNDDLKRLKEDAIGDEELDAYLTIGELKALLARLEASEQMGEYAFGVIGNHTHEQPISCKWCKGLKTWKEVCEK